MSTDDSDDAGRRDGPPRHEASGHEPHRARWIWPLPPVSRRTAEFVRRVAAWPTPVLDSWWWAPVSVAIGCLPFIAGYYLSLPGHQFAGALLLFPLYFCGVANGRIGKSLGVVAVAFAAHSAVVIYFSARDADAVAWSLPGAEAFWSESYQWVETGANPEYELSSWFPQHVLLLVAVVALGYCSFGLTVLARGFYEVDLMNYYVGRLISLSAEPVTAIIYGWHVWSLLRGVGCGLVMYEISAISLAPLTGNYPGAGRTHSLRLAAGIALLVLDGVLKFLLMDTVQARLQANLL